jgi:hypothetical protein
MHKTTCNNKNPKRATTNMDRQCYDLNKQCKKIARMTSNNPNDPTIRALYYPTRKKLKRTLKKIDQTKKNDILDKILTLPSSHTNEFWDLINKIDRKSKSDKADNIGADSWTKHFEDLLDKPLNTTDNNIIQNKISNFPTTFNEKDYRITYEELLSCLKKLKKSLWC